MSKKEEILKKYKDLGLVSEDTNKILLKNLQLKVEEERDFWKNKYFSLLEKTKK